MFQVEKEYLVIGGKPRFIYAGDFSYGRIPRAVWRDRLLMMKAAGINTVSFYCVWRYHETADNVWDFSGNHDVDHLLGLLGELGLYAIFRMGPFVHGEFRNGGYPDFLVEKLGAKLRSNDPEYLGYAERFYRKFLAIAGKHLITSGGPIILFQLENELGSAGCKGDDIPRGDTDDAENRKHLEFYSRLVREAGIDLPFIDINRIEGREELLGSRVDTGGHYPASCFGTDGELSPLRPRENRGVPYISIETGCGMFVRFFDYPAYRNTNGFQGPIIKAPSVEALAQQTVAEGASGVGFFIFCDGQHFGDDNESMIPHRDMNFQAPISCTGTLRDSYRGLKRLGWFLRSFETEILKTHPDPDWCTLRAFGSAHPGENPQSGDLFDGYGREIPAEAAAARALPGRKVEALARVTTGLNLSDSNFIFARNVSNIHAGWKRDVRIATTPNRLASEVFQEYPKLVQLELPPQTTKILPFFVKLKERCFLDHSTATLLDRRGYGNAVQLIAFATTDEFTESSFVLPDADPVRATPGLLIKRHSPNLVSAVGSPSRGIEAAEFGGKDGVRFILVDTERAGECCDIAEYAAFSSMQILESVRSGENVRISALCDRDFFTLDILSPHPLELHCGEAEVRLQETPGFGIRSFSGNLPGHRAPELSFHRSRAGNDLVLETVVTPDMLRDAADLVLEAVYDGEYGQAFLDGRLISDHYYGKFLVWEIGLAAWSRRSGAERLTLRIPGGRNCEIKIRLLRKYEFLIRHSDAADKRPAPRRKLQEQEV
ncbi:beta-galactosidase [uncultured Victivallis sp.]|uniref:beta-galactosidase n=1 Tax=uncultured Victivallis sp. TaxID=354118 RepID=UPI00258B0C26|nr:beta-galactosidase [uncultured Victivallis sp.]